MPGRCHCVWGGTGPSLALLPPERPQRGQKVTDQKTEYGGNMKRLFLVFLAVSAMGTSAFANDLGDFLSGIAKASAEMNRSPREPDRFPGARPGRPGPGRPGPGRPGPGYPDRGRLECSATDKGWEEHWGGHYDCRECLEKHDGCIETCQEVRTVYSCQFEGQDGRGTRESFAATSDDRRQAEYEAEDRCYRAGYRNCRYQGCNTSEDRDVVSRRDCGRR